MTQRANVTKRAQTGHKTRHKPQPKNKPPNSRIERWITVKKIVSRQAQDVQMPLRFYTVIERPQFIDGNLGYHRLMTTISVGDYHIRLPTRSLMVVMSWFEDAKQSLMDAIEEVGKLNDGHNGHIPEEAPQHPKAQKPGRKRHVVVDAKRNFRGKPPVVAQRRHKSSGPNRSHDR